ncbi:flagellar biosynthesis anti-sigma factor FlgM [Candidatus Poribacteria bacterium]|nr:flagellar biosynthesis anti-sigma factor FlgM [Candidatus Poribacteria bacterium]
MKIPPKKHFKSDLDLQKIKDLIDNSPEIQEDEILDLKAQIFNALYNIKADLVAEKIILHGNYMLNTTE